MGHKFLDFFLTVHYTSPTLFEFSCGAGYGVKGEGLVDDVLNSSFHHENIYFPVVAHCELIKLMDLILQ